MIPLQLEERSYDPAEVVAFHKKHPRWGKLSNFATGFPLVVSGVEWQTSEALYQACRFPKHPEVQRLISEQSKPMAAKMRGKQYRSQTRPDWDSARAKVMRWVLHVKLAQHYEQFSDVIQQTGVIPLVELSRSDRFWGAVEDGRGALKGANVLGILLMELREELRIRQKRDLSVVVPPDLEDFLILNRIVGMVHSGDQSVSTRNLF